MDNSAVREPSAETRIGRAFAGTRWSVVVLARGGDSPEAGKALEELCQVYWYPLYAFVRRSGHGHHEAEDLTQGFFLHFISRDSLAHVEPAKGKFRSFLLASLKHYLVNERERAGARKRGGGQVLVSIDMEGADGRYACEPADKKTPETVYERRWAMIVLESAMNELRQEYDKKGRADFFSALHDQIADGDVMNGSYTELAVQLRTTEGNLKVVVHRLRRRFGALIRAKIAQTVESDADVDDEIRYLMSCLSR